MNQFFLFAEDTRTPNEIQLSKQVTRQLTNLNLKRVHSPKKPTLPQSHRCHRQNYLYVCLSGIPPKKQEFDHLGLEGEKIYICPQGMDIGITEEQSRKQIWNAPLQKQAALVHERLKHRTDKPMVFVYHSFGSVIAAVLFRLYYAYYSSKVIGTISIGQYPIRCIPLLLNEIKIGYEKTIEQMLDNADSTFQNYLKEFSLLGIKLDTNKYSYLCRNIAFSQGIGFTEMFSYLRQFPPILKCFIYGRQDQVMTEENLSEVALFYSYKRKFSANYEQKIKNILEQKYGLQVDNVQQRFIYNIPEASHSLHWQKKIQPLLTKIIDQYLSVLEQIQAQQSTE